MENELDTKEASAKQEKVSLDFKIEEVGGYNRYCFFAENISYCKLIACMYRLSFGREKYKYNIRHR